MKSLRLKRGYYQIDLSVYHNTNILMDSLNNPKDKDKAEKAKYFSRNYAQGHSITKLSSPLDLKTRRYGTLKVAENYTQTKEEPIDYINELKDVKFDGPPRSLKSKNQFYLEVTEDSDILWKDGWFMYDEGTKKMKLKKGNYYIGDLCYVIKDNWSAFCEPYLDDEYELEYKGSKALIFGTAYGDGSYELKKDGERIAELWVDSGSLGFLPAKLIEVDLSKEKHLKAGEGYAILTFKEDFEIDYCGGNFKFKVDGVEYTCVTDGSDEDEEETEELEEENEE